MIMSDNSTDYLVLLERRLSPWGRSLHRYSFDGQIHSRGSLDGLDTAIYAEVPNPRCPPTLVAT